MNTGRHFENLAHLIYGLFGLMLILIGLVISNVSQTENETASAEKEETASALIKPKNYEEIQLGKNLFKNKCASCHAKNMRAKLTGPPLASVEERWENKEDLYAWIKNSPAYLETGDAYATQLWNDYNRQTMNAFPELENEDIDAILAYINFVSNP